MSVRLICIMVLIVRHSIIIGQGLGAYMGSYIDPGAYSLKHVTIFSALNNPAAITRTSKFSLGVYGERKYMLEGMQYFQAGTALPSGMGNFGLSIDHLGLNEYKENRVSLIYGRQVGAKVDVGVKFNYHLVRMGVYGSTFAVTADAAVILHLTEKLHSGMVIANPAGSQEAGGVSPGTSCIWGIGYESSDKFLATLEIIKEKNQPVEIITGIQYRVHPKLNLLFSLSGVSSVISIGVELSFKKFQALFLSSFHQVLGFTPGLRIIFIGGERKS
jgi:hypothetical protein